MIAGRLVAAEINGRLYFGGGQSHSSFHGYELWQIPLEPEPDFIPGDANRDGIFNSADLVQIFQRGEYEDQIEGNSIWEDGDWNGDGEFTSADLVSAFQAGNYSPAAIALSYQLDEMDLFDWMSDEDRKKRLAPDPKSIDEGIKQWSQK